MDNYTPSKGRFKVYRQYNADGKLLYVGQSHEVLNRTQDHNATAHWFDEIAFITIEGYPTREAALMAETNAIAVEMPYYNIRGKLAQELKEKYEEDKRLTDSLLGKDTIFDCGILAILRCKCNEYGGITAWAELHGMTRQLVHDILSGRRKVGHQVPRALGYKRMPTQYERIKK